MMVEVELWSGLSAKLRVINVYVIRINRSFFSLLNFVQTGTAKLREIQIFDWSSKANNWRINLLDQFRIYRDICQTAATFSRHKWRAGMTFPPQVTCSSCTSFPSVNCVVSYLLVAKHLLSRPPVCHVTDTKDLIGSFPRQGSGIGGADDNSGLTMCNFRWKCTRARGKALQVVESLTHTVDTKTNAL